MRKFGLYLLIMLVAATSVYAGMTITMKCSSCNYSSPVSSGGGRAFDQLTGYCTGCEKFVYLSWKRGGTKPAQAGMVWDPATGGKLDVYPCPDCGTVFTPVTGNLKFCPRCGKDAFAEDPKGHKILFD